MYSYNKTMATIQSSSTVPNTTGTWLWTTIRPQLDIKWLGVIVQAQ